MLKKPFAREQSCDKCVFVDLVFGSAVALKPQNLVFRFGNFLEFFDPCPEKPLVEIRILDSVCNASLACVRAHGHRRTREVCFCMFLFCSYIGRCQAQ